MTLVLVWTTYVLCTANVLSIVSIQMFVSGVCWLSDRYFLNVRVFPAEYIRPAFSTLGKLVSFHPETVTV
jgi:hypothetical protein